MYLTIDIGGHKYGAALCSAGGRVIGHRLRRTDLKADAATIVAGLLGQIDELRAAHPAEFAQVRSCGIGFGGPVRDNRPYRSLHVAGWKTIDLCDVVRSRFGLPAVMGNDGDVSALGEHRFGAGRGCGSLVYLTVSTGIGGGIVLAGRLWSGAHGFAGELGHIKIRESGPVCPCGGIGCLESLCSGTALGRVARVAAAADPQTYAGLTALAGGADRIDARAVFAAASSGDPASQALVDGYLDDLARGAGSILNAFDPDMLVIGGGVSKAGEALFAPLRAKTAAHVMPMIRDLFRIEPAALDDHTVFLGAAVLAAGAA